MTLSATRTPYCCRCSRSGGTDKFDESNLAVRAAKVNPAYTHEMATETAENYLKAIYTLCQESPTGEAGMSRIAGVVGVTTGTATSMVKKLAAGKLAKYERFGGVSLTPKGKKAALDILRRHRIVETFLVQTLKLDWSQVHDEAERLEHAISPRVLEALDRHLGHPTIDPHGDPIPSAHGEVVEPSLVPLSACASGQTCRLTRVLDQREQPLRLLKRHGLEIGARVRVQSIEPDIGTITVCLKKGEEFTLGIDAAGRLLVELLPAG